MWKCHLTNILCSTLTLWPSHGRHTRPIVNDHGSVCKLDSKRNGISFLSKMFLKAIMFAVLYPHAKSMFTEFFLDV